MKYCKTLLVLPLIAAMTAAGALSAAPTAARKADPAAEKAKADAQKRSQLWQQFHELRKEGSKAAADGDWNKVNETVKQVLPLFDQINALKPMDQKEMNNFSWCFSVFQPNRKGNKAGLRSYYETMIPKASGDVKADWISNCAYFFNEQKLEKSDWVEEFRNTRYDVPGLTSSKRFAYLMDDSRLEEADQLMRKMIAEQQDSKEKIKMIGRAISMFSGKKVYGSVFARKYYADLLALTTEPDAKSALITRWAKYAEEMAILSDEEIQKLRDSRFTLPGVSPKAKIEAYVDNICRSIDGNDIIVWRDKALAEAGNDPALRYRIVKLFSTHSYPPTLKLNCSEFTWYPEFFRREMAADPGFNRWQVSALMNDYVRHFRYNRYAEMEKEILDWVARNEKNYQAKQAAWKTAIAKIRQDKEAKKGNAAELNKLENEENARLADARERYTDAMQLLIRYYDMNAERYYEGPDPRMVRKEIAAIRNLIAFLLSCDYWGGAFRAAAENEFRIAELSFAVRDFDTVRKCAAQTEKYPELAAERAKTTQVKYDVWQIDG